jgi:hypothetical protein
MQIGRSQIVADEGILTVGLKNLGIYTQPEPLAFCILEIELITKTQSSWS